MKHTEEKALAVVWAQYASKILFDASLKMKHKSSPGEMLPELMAAKTAAQEFAKAAEAYIEQLKEEIVE